MLKNNSKTMFFVLLIPLYFLALLCILGSSVGEIMWLPVLELALLVLLAAWCLSRTNSLAINTAGFLIYAIKGGYIIYSKLTKKPRIGPWVFDIYLGTALILFGLCSYVYAIVRVIRKHKRTSDQTPV